MQRRERRVSTEEPFLKLRPLPRGARDDNFWQACETLFFAVAFVLLGLLVGADNSMMETGPVEAHVEAPLAALAACPLAKCLHLPAVVKPSLGGLIPGIQEATHAAATMGSNVPPSVVFKLTSGQEVVGTVAPGANSKSEVGLSVDLTPTLIGWAVPTVTGTWKVAAATSNSTTLSVEWAATPSSRFASAVAALLVRVWKWKSRSGVRKVKKLLEAQAR
jgi:hypothetical protein